MSTESPEPRLIQRSGTATGWLALSPPDARWQIGVEGRTAEAASARFRMSWAKWEELAPGVDLLQAQRLQQDEGAAS